MMCNKLEIEPWWGRFSDVLPKLRYASKIFERASSLEEMLVSSSLKPLDAALGEHQRALRMGKNDRNLLGMALYSASRSRNAIMEVIGADFPPGRLLTIGFLDATGELGSEVLDAFTPAEELVDILDKVNAKRHIWMQNIYGEWGEDLVSCTDETVDSICGLFSIPNVFIESGPWRKVNEAAGELVRGKDRQNIHLRCKRASGASEALMSELNQMDKGYWRSAYSESCIIAESPLNIRNFESFRLGMVEVQDEGSQLLIEAAAPFIKGKVLDLCAGGGGKSLAMSDLAPDTDIYAYDIDLRRLNGIYPRIRRAAAKNIKTLSSFDEVMSAAPYDFILIDAPCTSTGTMRRNPDINWRWSAKKIQEIVTTQYNLLRNSMDLVSRGGVVAYATCSLLAVENNLQFEKFLAEHIGLLEEVPPCAANGNPFSAKENRLSAGSRVPLNFTKYQGDAFFLALAKRL